PSWCTGAGGCASLLGGSAAIGSEDESYVLSKHFTGFQKFFEPSRERTQTLITVPDTKRTERQHPAGRPRKGIVNVQKAHAFRRIIGAAPDRMGGADAADGVASPAALRRGAGARRVRLAPVGSEGREAAAGHLGASGGRDASRRAAAPQAVL